MYIVATNQSGDYISCGAISNLSFAPQTDITGQSIPINEFYVEVDVTQTRDSEGLLAPSVTIPVGQYIFLHDDRDTLWAKYWIISSEHLSDSIVQIRAQSMLAKLERRTVDAVWYENETVGNILASAPFNLSANMFTIDSEIANVRITGYCPKQTLKDRLQEILFVAGGYVKTFFTDKIEILPIDDTQLEVPINKVFWRPSITYRDYTSKITMTSFSYEERQPQNQEEYVQVGNRFFVVTRTSHTLTNSAVPVNVPADEIEVQDVYLVNSTNVDAILSRLAVIYFKRDELDADIINNADYEPGQMLAVTVDPISEGSGRMSIGYVDSCTFSFGLQSRSRIHMMVQEMRETTELVITYIKGNTILGRQRYKYPVGYSYSIENPYIDINSGRHRYVYRPLTKNATGTMVEGTNVATVNYADALIFYYDNNVLEIISVSEVSATTDEEVVVNIE